MKFGHRKGRFHKGNASRLGKLGVKVKAEKRMAKPSDREPRRVPDRELLEVIQIQSKCGQVRKWVVLQGPRANNIRVLSKSKEVVCGWDKLTRMLRKNLSRPRRIFA